MLFPVLKMLAAAEDQLVQLLCLSEPIFMGRAAKTTQLLGFLLCLFPLAVRSVDFYFFLNGRAKTCAVISQAQFRQGEQ